MSYEKTIDSFSHIKYENEDHPFVETPFKDMKNVKHVGDMENYEGLVKGELPKDEVKIITELAENLHYYHKKESMNLNQVAQWLLEKPLNEIESLTDKIKIKE